MSRPATLIAIGCCVLTGGFGCVSVDTPDAKVNVGITQVNLPGSNAPDPETAPYAKPLEKVSKQQAEVAKQISEADWNEVVDESSDWIDQINRLSRYAGSSHDPQLFSNCCRQLLAQVQALRQAAMRRDRVATQNAFDACDPPLSTLVQSFPPKLIVRSAAAASAPPPQPQPARPSTPRPLVP